MSLPMKWNPSESEECIKQYKVQSRHRRNMLRFIRMGGSEVSDTDLSEKQMIHIYTTIYIFSLFPSPISATFPAFINIYGGMRQDFIVAVVAHGGR